MSSEAGIADWLIVMRADGVVDAVSGGAPVSWLGHGLADAAGVPDALREAALHLLGRPMGHGYLRRAKVNTAAAIVDLILVEAMPVRRAHTRIAEVVTRTMDVFVAQARSGNVELTVSIADDVPPTLHLDGEKISWALATLVGNALRFAQHGRSHPERGRGRVSVGVAWVHEPPQLVVTVEDNGPGMSERQSRWLFERDPTTSKTAGLALVLVKDVVIAHRGSVDVESRPGSGTSFTVRLPRVAPAP